ncbi:uncharacterized protein LOC133190061 [Saccostrea echinata]|uniref:uncharacterized protein LOC133190061 n=1 Tax=Saccostrea echinata TaxID=191078 RepID=UPI002A80D51C|nr:uncharacterized protein LOC133190061 [Saccostrea echinata]
MASESSPSSSTCTSVDEFDESSGHLEFRKRKTKDDSYGRDFKIARGSQSKGESVSNWKIHKLDKLGLSYKNHTSNFQDFFKVVKKFGFGPLSEEKKSILESLTELIKKAMSKTSFNIRRKENAEYCKGELKSCIEVTEEIKPLWDNLVTEGKLTWYHTQILVHLLNFYEQFTLFLRTRCVANTCPPVEANYTALLASFVEIFLLRAKQGGEFKSIVNINGVPTSAAPALRLVNVGSLQDIERNLCLCVIAVVEVKRTAKRSGSSEKFDIHSALWDDVLAQHAGELLLEYQNTQYASKDCDTKVILGFICLETTLIFTWLELSDIHYADIKEGNLLQDDSKDEDEKEIKDKKESGKISYTKPYDYLLKEDREQILDFLYELAFQSEERFSASKKRKS